MQRLYVGGLSHTVTQKDLKDRFGKFGDVEEVELRIRKDAEGQEFMNMNQFWLSIVSVNYTLLLNVDELTVINLKCYIC